MQQWTTIIQSKNRLLNLKIKELWQYRDLIAMFVKRDFKTMYKQTILESLWIVINPILTTLIQVLVFGNIANISTDGMPQICFIWQEIQCGFIFRDALQKLRTHL